MFVAEGEQLVGDGMLKVVWEVWYSGEMLTGGIQRERFAQQL